MQIDRLLYPVHSLGPGNRLVIWVRGCKKRCFNCANPELQFFNPKSEISMPIIKDTICEIGEKFDGITITGGEPFCQAKELLDLITFEELLAKNGFYHKLYYSQFDTAAQN